MADKEDFEDDYDMDSEIEDELLSDEEYQFDDSDSEEELSFGTEDSQDFSLLEDENFDDDDEDSYPGEGGNPLEQLINRLKNEEPKKLAMLAGGALFALFAVIFAGLQLFGGSSAKPQPVPATKSTLSAADKPKASPISNLNVPAPVENLPENPTPPPENKATQGTVEPTTPATPPSPVSGSEVTPPVVTAPPVSTAPVLGVPSSTNPALTNPVPPVTTDTTSTSVITTVPTASSSTLQNNEATSALSDRLTKLEQQQGTVDQRLSTLEKQGTDSATEMGTLSHGINNIETQVMELNNLLVKLTSKTSKVHKHPLTEEQAEEAAGRKAKKSATPKETLTYYVQAIVPGRAWLKDSNEKIITVAVGDLVPGYGTVTNIDARNGVVTTSSGTKIEYGIDQF